MPDTLSKPKQKIKKPPNMPRRRNAAAKKEIPEHHMQFLVAVAEGADYLEAYRRTISKDCAISTAQVNGCKIATAYRLKLLELKKGRAKSIEEATGINAAVLGRWWQRVMETPADEIKAGDPLIQKIRRSKDGDTIEVPSKMAASENLARALGVFKETVEVDASDEVMAAVKQLFGRKKAS